MKKQIPNGGHSDSGKRHPRQDFNRDTTGIHKPDGIFSGEKIGNADRESHIRKRDGVIFKGGEMGYVDRDKNVRRPDGVLFKGEVVGKIKENRAHAKDGIIFSGEEWGYVDESGNIRQRDGVIFSGRIIGKMRGHNKEAALGFFVLRFNNLVKRFEELEREARGAEHKGKYIGKVRHMLEYVPDFDGLGDFDGLINRLRRLEADLVNEVERHRASRANAKKALISEAQSLSNSTDWKAAGEKIKSLQERWKGIEGAGKEEESLWQSFRNACDRFFERRKSHFDSLDRERSQNAARKRELCSAAESLRHSHDLKDAAERVKELQKEWKTIGHVPKEIADSLWERFRNACDAVFGALKEEREHRQHEWREKMRGALSAKQEQEQRLRESIEHDEGNVSRWQDVIYNLRDGRGADEIRNSMESKISDVESRISSKKEKLREIERAIEDISEKLRG